MMANAMGHDSAGEVAVGDDRSVRLRLELNTVRKELERLVESRLLGDWSTTTNNRYQHLTTRERWLLDLGAA